MVCTVFFSMVDLIICLLNVNSPTPTYDYAFPWITEMLKPVLLLSAYQDIRLYARRFIYVVINSSGIVFCILFYVFFFCYQATYLFAGTVEGSLNFPGISDSFYTLFISLTTSNFPNVMLPGYGINRLTCLFVIFYLMMGLFLLLNLLLAVVYTKYQDRSD